MSAETLYSALEIVPQNRHSEEVEKNIEKNLSNNKKVLSLHLNFKIIWQEYVI